MSDRISRLSAAIGRAAPKALSLDSIRGRIVVFALLATLIPTGITAWLAYSQTESSRTRQTNQELSSGSSQAARELSIWLKERAYELKIFTGSFQVAENLARMSQVAGRSTQLLEATARLNNYLVSVQERFPNLYDELLVVDSQQTILGTSARTPGQLHLPETWLQTVRGNREAIGNPFWEDQSGHASITMAVPILGALDGRLLGALAARVNLRALEANLTTFPTGETGQVYLVSRTGSLVVSSRGVTRGQAGLGIPQETLASLRRAKASSIRFTNYEGQDVVGSLTALPDLPWAAVAEISREEAFAEIARVRNITLALVFVVLVVVSFIAYRLALLIVRPLDRLTTGARGVGSGDLAVELPKAGGGEVGYLTDVFNVMVARLRAGREELEAIHEDLRTKNEELERLSVTDALTGVSNRRLLMETLRREVQRSGRTDQPFSVLMLDVDGFKAFNDTYGHQAGDAALVMLAAVLRECTRVVDCVARYGGEEFVIMLHETDLASASEVAERIRVAVADRRVPLEGEDAFITVSIGIAQYPGDGGTHEAVLKAADGTLYDAKQQGRNRVVLTTAHPKRRRSRSGSKINP
ncbi:MAG: diguanylate cyclase [Gemmatimonadota bacterium]|nr:diguanylate cyclase [Gemmatimonadota bacterium]